MTAAFFAAVETRKRLTVWWCRAEWRQEGRKLWSISLAVGTELVTQHRPAADFNKSKTLTGLTGWTLPRVSHYSPGKSTQSWVTGWRGAGENICTHCLVVSNFTAQSFPLPAHPTMHHRCPLICLLSALAADLLTPKGSDVFLHSESSALWQNLTGEKKNCLMAKSNYAFIGSAPWQKQKCWIAHEANYMIDGEAGWLMICRAQRKSHPRREMLQNKFAETKYWW